MTPTFKIPLMALVLTAIMAVPALAERDGATPHPDKAHAEMPEGGKMERGGKHGIPMSEDDMSKVEKMDPAGRDAFFKERREEYKKMSPEQREKLRAERKAWFDSLSAEKKEALKERHKKIRAEFIARKKAEFEKLPPEEQAKMKAKRQERMEKWKERRGDKDGDKSENKE